jgi:acyl carrier protein
VRTEQLDRSALRRDLRALIVKSRPEVDGDLDDDTPLITSGLVESTTLLEVALWIEDHIGREIDLSAFNLATEWDSMRTILDFVDRHAARSSAPPAPAL